VIWQSTKSFIKGKKIQFVRREMLDLFTFQISGQQSRYNELLAASMDT
jgi:hypothetical protein